ncbi:hypothetical protein [Yoonia sp. SS1-5]|uniref:Uncharacterized protein n=1 Tax=Yoonia rhodophyticola TaxID=3137370 RepID=A0AAN0MFQ5_9RHOB
MTNENIHPRGHMTLILRNDAGKVIETIKHPNRVLDGGRTLLLNMLRGNSAATSYGLILGAEGFEPEADRPLTQDTAIPVTTPRRPTLRLANGVLSVSFNGNIEREGVIIGGGMTVTSTAGSTETVSLYNFAPTPRGIEMEANQSVSVNFRLTME